MIHFDVIRILKIFVRDRVVRVSKLAKELKISIPLASYYLTQMIDTALIKKVLHDNRSAYRITDAGIIWTQKNMDFNIPTERT